MKQGKIARDVLLMSDREEIIFLRLLNSGEMSQGKKPHMNRREHETHRRPCAEFSDL